MDNVTRIGVSIEPDLLEQFDDMIAHKGYTTRSEAFRDLIRDALSKNAIEDVESRACGTITLIYNHHKGGVKEHLMEIQHNHHSSISSSIHVHLDLERCLEVLIVSGTVKEIMSLSDALDSVKGVQSGKPAIISAELPESDSEHDHGHEH